MLTKQVNGFEIAYEEAGYASGPPLVLLTGWAHDMRLYDEMLPLLVAKYRVIRMCWRGHGPKRDDVPDFGVEEQVQDVIGLLDALDVHDMYLVSHSHGSWAGLELAERLGPSRVHCLLMIDQIMSEPPLAFADTLVAMNGADTWLQARQGLFRVWQAGSRNKAVQDHFYYNMGSFGRSMWALSCRVIEDAYKRHGSPMNRMEKLENPPPIRHIFSHPVQSPEYRKLHEDFAARHAFFSYADLGGETHFPNLEIPDQCVEQIDDLVSGVAAKGRV